MIDRTHSIEASFRTHSFRFSLLRFFSFFQKKLSSRKEDLFFTMSAKSQIEEAGKMFADDSGEMSAANFKIVRFFYLSKKSFMFTQKHMQAMRALPKICGFPTSEEVMRALKMVCTSLISLFSSLPSSLSLSCMTTMTKTKMKKKTVRRIRRTSERVELRQSHDGSSIKVW